MRNGKELCTIRFVIDNFRYFKYKTSNSGSGMRESGTYIN